MNPLTEQEQEEQLAREHRVRVRGTRERRTPIHSLDGERPLTNPSSFDVDLGQLLVIMGSLFAWLLLVKATVAFGVVGLPAYVAPTPLLIAAVWWALTHRVFPDGVPVLSLGLRR